MAEKMKRCEFVVEMVSSNKKKRKLVNDGVEFESPESSTVKKSLRVTDLENVDDDDDLKVKDCEKTEISTSIDDISSEKTPTSELYGKESDSSTTSSNKKSSSKPRRQRRIPKTTTMPSEAELEEFFSAEEKHQQKQFAEKYNFDVVKDVPLQGKYQWVRLQ